MKNEWVKFVVFVPETHADAVRKALAEAGAGSMGEYSDCSFSVKGIGRFRPLEGAKPAIGKAETLEEVAEERIETICRIEDISAVFAAVRAVHPYEQIAYDVYPLLNRPIES